MCRLAFGLNSQNRWPKRCLIFVNKLNMWALSFICSFVLRNLHPHAIYPPTHELNNMFCSAYIWWTHSPEMIMTEKEQPRQKQNISQGLAVSVHIHIYIYIFICICLHIYAHVRMYACLYVCMWCVCMYACMYVYVCMWCVHVCMYIFRTSYVHIYIYIVV